MAAFQDYKLVNVVIADDGTTSSAGDMEDFTLCGLITPANMVGTSVSFTASTTLDGTYLSVRNSSNAVRTVTVTNTAQWYSLSPADFSGIRYLRVVSGSSETGGPLTLTLVGMRVDTRKG